MHINIVGPYPPPIGGISIHIERLSGKLEKANISHLIFNHYDYSDTKKVIATQKSKFWYIKFLFKKVDGIIHFHQFSYWHYFYYLTFCLFKKNPVFITIHEDNILKYHPIKRELAFFCLRNTKSMYTFCVSKRLSRYLNIRQIKSKYLPGFIPPSAVTPKKNHSFNDFFVFSMWKVTPEIADSIYGMSLAFELLNKIDLPMLFLVGSRAETDTYFIDKTIRKYNVNKKIKVLYDQPLVDNISGAKFILRTNNIDGYGISLEEAMYLNTPAIATNVCKRPKGTILFEAGNLLDLTNIVSRVLSPSYKPNTSFSSDCSQKLIELYRAAHEKQL